MVGTNKNQSIHEVLTKLDHLDNHKPYGGLSMILTGDLKQLGNSTITTESLCLTSFFRTSKRCIHFQTSDNPWKIKSSGKYLE